MSLAGFQDVVAEESQHLAARGHPERTHVFDSVVTGDDVAEQKPHPGGLLAVAKALGVPSRECAFIGDSPADIGAGKNAGMITVAAGWHPVYLDEIRGKKPDVWAEEPADVVRLIDASK